MTVISADHLHKHYGSNYALDNFSMSIGPKRIVGLIGPNGAGKTTLLRAVMGLNRVEGELSVLGLNPFTQRHQLMLRASYIADVGTLPRWIKVAELLDFVAGVHPSFDKQNALGILEASKIKLSSKVRTLSKGMVTQLHLALISSINAELLVLDEPTLGLDIIYRQEFYNRVLTDFHEKDRSIIISTHEVREIEHILTDVIFIDEGKNILSMATEDITHRFHLLSVSETNLAPAQALNPFSQRSTWNGHELMYKDTDPDLFCELGEITTPNLAELFIGCMGEAR